MDSAEKPAASNPSRSPRKTPPIYFLLYLIGLVIFFILPYVMPREPGARTLPFSDFMAQVNGDHLSQIEITPTEFIGMLKP